MSAPTKATKGGVLLYINTNLIYKPRPDLNIYSDKEIESCFAENINPKGKNSVVGVIYRHPTGNPYDFLDTHLKPLLQNTLSKDISNKHVYIAGDFNFDLTNIANKETSDFFLYYDIQLIDSIYLATN